MARFRHLCLATSLLLGCAPARAPGPSSKEAPGALDRLRHEADHARWHYVVTAEDDLEDLVIEASLEGAASPRLGVDRPAERFLYGVEVLRDDAWRPALVDDGEVVIPDCQRRCRLRYRFALRAAAEQLRDEEVADWEGGTALSPPSAWLLRPP
ncbi:MAG: hypothetical protein KC731_21720, partial [Myxococcales bacterium]|nr:hypothetical protein [Myxococcales bacterium]